MPRPKSKPMRPVPMREPPKGWRYDIRRETASYENTEVAISVHHYIGMGETWFLTARPFGIDRRQLTSTSLPEAKVEAMAYLASRMQVLQDQLAHAIETVETVEEG